MSLSTAANHLHFIALGGSHGCLPDNCQAYETLESAIDGLDFIYELETWQRVELSKLSTLRDADGLSVALNADQGGAYCEVSRCDCSEPWIHGEGDDPDNWPDYAEAETETEAHSASLTLSSAFASVMEEHNALISYFGDVWKDQTDELARRLAALGQLIAKDSSI